MKRGPWIVALSAALAFLPAAAQAADVGVLDQLVNTFSSSLAAFQGPMLTYAKELFAALCGIEIVWTFGWFMLGKPDWPDIFGFLVRQLVTIGFFWWVMVNWGTFAQAIVQSFGIAGNGASIAAGGGQNLSPSDVVGAGMRIVHAVWAGMVWEHPLQGILLVIAGIIVCVVYGIIAARLIEVLIESYFVACAGILLMGFGGSKYTRHYAEAQFRFAISVGVKRLILQLLIGVSEKLMSNWSTTISLSGSNMGWDAIALIIIVPLVLLYLAEKLPYRAQDMVNGSVSHGGGGVGGAGAAVAGAAVGAAAALAGSGAAVASAFKSASSAMASAGGSSAGAGGGGSGGSSGGGGGGEGGGGGGGEGSGSGGGGGGGLSGAISQAAMITGRAGSILAKQTAADVGRRLGGNTAARNGHIGWRVASNISRADEAKNKQGQ